MIILSSICIGLASFLLIFKLIEHIQSSWWVYRYGRGFSKELYTLLGEWKRTRRKPIRFNEVLENNKKVWSSEEWPFTTFFMKNMSWANGFFVRFVFRYPTLMILQSLAVTSATKPLTDLNNGLVVAIGITLLWIGVWIGIIHMLVDRLMFGYLANHFSRISIDVERSDNQQLNELNPLRRDLVLGFAVHFAAVLAVTILAYTVIYMGLNDLEYLKPSDHNPVFYGISSGWKVPFELLYFSIVTIATVGYGDIYPMQSHLISRLAVASEILSGLSLFFFLITAFSLTVEPDTLETKERAEE